MVLAAPSSSPTNAAFSIASIRRTDYPSGLSRVIMRRSTLPFPPTLRRPFRFAALRNYPESFACLHTQKGILSRTTESFYFFMCCRDHPRPSPVLLRTLCRKLPHTSHGDDYPLRSELSPRYPNTAYLSRSLYGTRLFFGLRSPIHRPAI